MAAATPYILFGILILGLFSTFASVLAFRAARQGKNSDISVHLASVETLLKQIDSSSREEARALREEIRSTLGSQNALIEGRLTSLSEKMDTKFSSFTQEQANQISAFRKETIEGREQLEQTLKRSTDSFSEAQSKQIEKTHNIIKDHAEKMQVAQKEARENQEQALLSVTGTLKELIETNNSKQNALKESIETKQKEARDAQERGLLGVTKTIQELTEVNSTKQDAMRETLNKNLDQLRKDNEAKLEQMRLTVDEKLQETLQKRIGESFQIVSDRLELVHKGLGEMQSLATGVGDLKRVLTNVKTRGAWGEVQLAMLLEDMLTRDQFETNVKIRPSSGEVVEFAIRLPGKEDGTPVYLPIDSKFPHEDYERLLAAQERGIAEEISVAEAALQRAIKSQAKIISDKYIHPPHSTDFAIMYLPTEGLFAEAIRMTGLVNDIQGKFRVVITGPTTLAALLNSLQMGFKTLAIEKRSSEVWQVLGEAKAEFRKYGDVLDKLRKQLQTAQKTVEEAGTRTRAVEKRLKNVEVVAAPHAVEDILLTTVVEDLEETGAERDEL